MRRGILEVEVDSAVLLQELAHYHKRWLLEALRATVERVARTDLPVLLYDIPIRSGRKISHEVPIVPADTHPARRTGQGAIRAIEN